MSKKKPHWSTATMSFGKYDIPVRDIPVDYCRWLLAGMMREERCKYHAPTCNRAIALIYRTMTQEAIAAAVEQLIREHQQKYRTFKAEEFREWMSDGWKAWVLWLGVAHCNSWRQAERRKEWLAANKPLEERMIDVSFAKDKY